jgi:hypothetical protein
MQKLILQLLFLIAGFFATWFLLNQVNWMTIFKVEESGDKMEEKIGELYVELFAQEEIYDKELLNPSQCHGNAR